MSPLNAWWSDDPTEPFWMEVTGRPDIGANLKAPQTNEKGGEFWGYSLLKHVEPGDVVLHYDRNEGQVVGASIASGQFWEQEIVWAARGTYARQAGIEPHLRPGWYVGLEGYRELEEPLRLDEIRERTAELQGAFAAREAEVGKLSYYPFESGKSRPIRALQGYLFKLPAFFLDVFPRLSDVVAASPPRGVPGASEGREIGADYRRPPARTRRSAQSILKPEIRRSSSGAYVGMP